jgi:chorismate synthase
MSGDIWGRRLRLAVFGESHGPAIGGVVNGLPSGLPIDEGQIALYLKRRAPGRGALSTARREADEAKILSGAYRGKATGEALAFVIQNTDARSEGYSPDIPRPGHADFAARARYKGFADYRGGGHFSGRLTAPLVFCGALAQAILKERGAEALAKIERIGPERESGLSDAEFREACAKEFPVLSGSKAEKMAGAILRAKEEGDSVGGIVEARAFGLPAGVGDPIFEGVESVASSLLFSIPALKAVSFGDGFALAEMRGSEANDAMEYGEGGQVRHLSNHNGGILGGITNGQTLRLACAFKPTPSISRAQRSVNLATGENAEISVKGRHDPCIVPRAVVCVEAALAIALADCLIS